MTENKPKRNRQAIRSINALQDALLSLLDEQPYPKFYHRHIRAVWVDCPQHSMPILKLKMSYLKTFWMKFWINFLSTSINEI